MTENIKEYFDSSNKLTAFEVQIIKLTLKRLQDFCKEARPCNVFKNVLNLCLCLYTVFIQKI